LSPTGPDEVSLAVADNAGVPVLSIGSLVLRPLPDSDLAAGTRDGSLLAVRWTDVAVAGAVTVPVFIPGRNRAIFQTAGLIHPILRTALLPIASLFALDFGAAVGGTVILIEPVFGINGVGAYAQQSVAHLDLPPLMALTLYSGFLIVIVNAVADFAYSRLDPRIRLE